MGDNTKIDWADATWNPVTGCLRGCEYCYARKNTERFGGLCYSYTNNETCCECDMTDSDGSNHILDEKQIDAYTGRVAPYPFMFDPTFHRYRLDVPKHWAKPRTIFVCSMADLFGDWVPDEWIRDVFEACDKAPQHRYLFLTKNPKRFVERSDFMPPHRHFTNVAELWFGQSVTGNHPYTPIAGIHRFVSIEPILERFVINQLAGIIKTNDWVIVGGETGSRKDKVVPRREWVEEIAEACSRASVPIFMKSSLSKLMGSNFRQEYPWEANNGRNE